MKHNDEIDPLKQLVNEQRDEFDIHSPPPLKLNFEKSSKEPVKNSNYGWLKIAASISVIIGIGSALLFNQIFKSPDNSTAQLKENSNPKTEQNKGIESFQLAAVSEELAELEGFYIQQVKLKSEAVQAAGLDEEALEMLDILDAEFEALKLELGPNIDNDVIIEKMITTYKLKLDLLNQMLESVEENKENKSLEKINNHEELYTVYN